MPSVPLSIPHFRLPNIRETGRNSSSLTRMRQLIRLEQPTSHSPKTCYSESASDHHCRSTEIISHMRYCCVTANIAFHNIGPQVICWLVPHSWSTTLRNHDIFKIKLVQGGPVEKLATSEFSSAVLSWRFLTDWTVPVRIDWTLSQTFPVDIGVFIWAHFLHSVYQRSSAQYVI